MIRTPFFGSSDAYTPPTDPPSAAPVSAGLVKFGGGLFGIFWSNGDSAAETEIGYRQDPLGVLEPTTFLDKVAPGLTTWNGENFEYACYYWVRHRKGGQVSAWTRAEHDYDDCVGDPPAQ
jgi:hypothetical protein